MVTVTPEEKKQKRLILIFIIVVLATITVLLFGFFRKAEPVETIGSRKPIFSEDEIKIDFEILESPFLKKLQPFEKIEPYKEGIGRKNPFLSY